MPNFDHSLVARATRKVKQKGAGFSKNLELWLERNQA
jgi:hypothetical protein